MQIKARCRYNVDVLKALVCFTLFKKAAPKKGLMLWTALCLVLIVIDVIELVAFDLPFFSYVGLVVSVVYLCFIYFFYFAVPKIRYKVMSVPEELEIEYAFYDDRLKIFTSKAGKAYEKEIAYSSLTKVAETSKYWFLYFEGKRTYLVDKSTLEHGKVDDVRLRLGVFVGNKYYLCEY